MQGRSSGGAWRAVAPFFGANVLFGAGLFAHAFLYNFYLDALGFGEATMGAAAAALTAGGLAALAPAGLALDRWGGRATYLGATLLGAAGLAWGGLATSVAAVYVAAALAGAGAASWRVAQGPVLMSVTDPSIRSRAFSWNVGLLLGFGAAWTAVAGQVPAWMAALTGAGPLAGLRIALVAGAVGTLLGGVVFLAVPPTPRTVRSGRVRPADVPVGPGPERASSAAPERSASALAIPGAGGLLALQPRVRLLVFWVFVWMAGAALVLPFLNLYFLRVHALPVERIGFLFAGVQGLTALVVLAGGEVAQRVGPRRAFAGWMLLFPAALLPLALGLPLAVAVVLYAVQGLVPPATNPLLDEIVLQEADPSLHGVASSWRNGATELAGLVGAASGGLLLERASFPVLFTVAALVALVGGAGLVARLRKPETRRHDPSSSVEPESPTRPRTTR